VRRRILDRRMREQTNADRELQIVSAPSEVPPKILLRLKMPAKKDTKKIMPKATARMQGEETPAQRRKRLAEEKKARARR
jgi:hypothetical protein